MNSQGCKVKKDKYSFKFNYNNLTIKRLNFA